MTLITNKEDDYINDERRADFYENERNQKEERDNFNCQDGGSLIKEVMLKEIDKLAGEKLK